DGIHVGQDDTPIDEIQRQFPNKIIGLSVSNNQEVTQSPIELIDYIGAGPIYATGTKEDAKPPVGVKMDTLAKEQISTITHCWNRCNYYEQCFFRYRGWSRWRFDHFSYYRSKGYKEGG